MNHFKVVYNNIVVDILADPKWVRWAKKSNRFILTDITSANGVIGSDGSTVYCIKNTDAFGFSDTIYKKVTIVSITEIEYNSLKSKIIDKSVNSDGVEVSLKDLISQKLSDLSNECQAIISNGVDIVLSDGIQHHFSLQLTDQINIAKLKDMAVAGESFLPYHADGEPCKIYSTDDVLTIYSCMENLVIYHTTYFNSLKIYINNLTDRNSILDAKYGMEIPDNCQSEIYKVLLSQKGDR